MWHGIPHATSDAFQYRQDPATVPARTPLSGRNMSDRVQPMPGPTMDPTRDCGKQPRTGWKRFYPVRPRAQRSARIIISRSAWSHDLAKAAMAQKMSNLRSELIPSVLEFPCLLQQAPDAVLLRHAANFGPVGIQVDVRTRGYWIPSPPPPVEAHKLHRVASTTEDSPMIPVKFTLVV